jgi:nitric-oxide synthase
MSATETLLESANSFLRAFHAETAKPGLDQRLEQVHAEVLSLGTYTHTEEELAHGARMAWRNSNRCIGRLFWKSLVVVDRRDVASAAEVRDALVHHLEQATQGGRIRPTITVFPPMRSDGSVPVRIWNKHLIRYAGYTLADGKMAGDPAQAAFTEVCHRMGWRGKGTDFDILPLLVSMEGDAPSLYEWPEGSVLEVPLSHPEHPWLGEMRLKWHAVPVISDMVLEIGGIRYPAAPFNGWYMGTEIGSRNLGDESRYNLLPVVAERMGLDMDSASVLWKDRALVVLNEAVRFSFDAAGVTLTDHHEASDQFLKFIRNERSAGRPVTADWAWIVPPMSASALTVFHQAYDDTVVSPNFFYADDAWRKADSAGRCPFHQPFGVG